MCRTEVTPCGTARTHAGKVLLVSIIACCIAPRLAAGSDPRTIGTAALHSMMMDNAYRLEAGRKMSFTIVDARSKQEYAEAHVLSAISIPEEDFRTGAELLPADRSAPLIVYGDDASPETTARWAVKAAAAGYTNVAVYAEGFRRWKEKDMPVAPLRKGT